MVWQTICSLNSASNKIGVIRLLTFISIKISHRGSRFDRFLCRRAGLYNYIE